MCSSDSTDVVAATRRRLAEIREDRQIWGLALRHAGHPDLADDALQRTCDALVRLKNPGRIKVLRAYFCTVLIREIQHERGQLGAALIDDFERVAETRQGAAGCQLASPPVDDAVCGSLQAEIWLDRFTTQRDHLLAAIPARSDDPARYRAVIYKAAGQVLWDGIMGDASDADSNDAFRAAYPQWFSPADCAADTLYQRFRRAREDVKTLLQSIVSRDELTEH